MNRRVVLKVAGAAAATPAISLSSPVAPLRLTSPDQNLKLEFSLGDATALSGIAQYSVSYRGQPLISPSSLNCKMRQGGALSDLRIIRSDEHDADATYTMFPGKASTARDQYRELNVQLEEQRGLKRRVNLVFRAYNDGVAFRYHFPQQPGLSELELVDEYSTFAFAPSAMAYALPLPTFTTPYEAYYRKVALSDIPADPLIGLPLLLECLPHVYVAITEAALVDYAGMYVSAAPGSKNTLISRLSPRTDDPWLKVRFSLPHVSPWRVVMVADTPGKLIESNLISNLNKPSAIADTSWIKPGKTTFPWWNGYEVGDVGFKGAQNTQTHKHYIDFCAEAGIPYHSLDGLDNIAWYGGPIVPYRGADLTKSLPEIDLAELIAYAKQKGVRLRFWMSSAAARAQMHKAFPVYEQWGIEGVMVDFFERDDQDAIRFVEDLLQLAAKHHLTVTLHNIAKPTGLSRTYPHLLTLESVLNEEYNKWDPKGSTPEHEVTIPFTRMLAGPMDYHSGSFHNVAPKDFKVRNIAPMTMGTRARELARYVVYEGCLPMMVDYPAAYRGQPGLDFVVRVPTTWDETKVIGGEIGQYITIARRSGRTWYVGSMSNAAARELRIPLQFLGAGNFNTTIYSDDPTDPAKVNIDRRKYAASEAVTAVLSSAGGHVLQFSPA